MSPDTSADPAARRQELERQHGELALPRFTLEDAWVLGSGLAAAGIEAGHPIAIDIRRPHHVLFHAALPGATADNDEWIARKARACLRLETSTALLALRFAEFGLDPLRGWLPDDAIAAGGSVPVRVEGVGVVAAVTVSGLASDEDHDIVVAALEALRDRLRGTAGA